jgi:hypothetical protein
VSLLLKLGLKNDVLLLLVECRPFLFDSPFNILFCPSPYFFLGFDLAVLLRFLFLNLPVGQCNIVTRHKTAELRQVGVRQLVVRRVQV